MPRLLTYSFTEVTGSLDIELKILGFELFQFPLINLVSSYEDSYSYVNHPSESFTRYINLVTPTTPPTTLPTTPPTTPPTTTPSDTTTPEIAIGLIVPIVSILIFVPIIIVIRRKKKEY